MQLEIEIQDTSKLTRGVVVPFILTITNNGPDDSDFVVTIYNDREVNDDIFVLSNLSFIADDSIEQDCEFFPINGNDTIPNIGPDYINFYFVITPDLAANSSLTCHGLALASINKTTKIVFNLSVRTDDIDDDLSNNTQSVTFGVKPPLIPTLSQLSLFVLAFLLLLLGFRQFHIKFSQS
jgi:hypothetical protein